MKVFGFVLESTLTCPDCAGQWRECMPTDRFQTMRNCPGCGHVLRAGADTCCIYCNDGSDPCPLVQAIRRCLQPPPLIAMSRV